MKDTDFLKQKCILYTFLISSNDVDFQIHEVFELVMSFKKKVDAVLFIYVKGTDYKNGNVIKTYSK